MIDTQKFSAWIQAVQGQYINMDGAYGAQCWDLHAHFADWFGLPRVDTGYPGRWPGWAGNMYDAYPQTAEIEAAYERIPGSQPAQAGDTAIWDDSFWYYPKTHVAEVVKDGAQLLCISQNSTPSVAGNPYPEWSTGPATLQHLPKGGLLGYLRPRTGINYQGTITVQEDDMALSDLQTQEALQKVLRDNDLIIGNRSVAEGINQTLLGIDATNERIAGLTALLGQIMKAQAANQATYFLKGDKSPEVYALDVATGKLRHVLSAEFDVVTSIGIFKTVAQAKVDALLKGV